MVTVPNPPPGHHYKVLPDGTQILVDDRTGQVVGGTGTGPAGAAPVATTAQTTAPAPAGGTPMPGLPGGVYSPGPPSQPSGGGPSGVTPRAAGQLSGNVQPRGAPPAPDANVAPPTPGSDTYDWYAINNALRAAGMDGWQIAGGSHSPINEGKWIKNPDYDADTNPNVEQYILQPGATYQIGVVNPATNQMLKLTLGQNKQPDGNYGWTITGRDDQGKIDKVQAGYTNAQQLPFADGHVELWGTNTATGAFEKMPGTPEGLGKLQGWNDVKQIDDGQGHKIWVGTNPQGQPMQPIPDAPTLNADKYVAGSVKQVTKNGKLVYVGINAQTGEPEDIPGYGTEAVKPTTTTIGKNVYTVDPNGNLVIASAVAQPKEGDVQWVDAGAGYGKQQTFHNGDWHDDDVAQKPVRPDVVRAAGALKQRGEKYWIPLTGSPDKLVQVTADGNGGYTYETGPNGEPPPVKTIPGIREPTEITGAGTSQFLPSRRDPATGQLIPGEPNPNWQPSNVGDRVRQLQDQARAKQTELHGQVVAGALSEDAANQQFNDWWQQSIEPAKQEIQFAQQQKIQEQQRLQIEQQRSNLATAQNAGQAAVTAIAGEHRVGPGFGALMGQLTSAGASNQFPQTPTGQQLQSAFVTPMPDYNKIYEQATAQALAHISPTAAQIATGSPTPSLLPQLQGIDINSALNRTQYPLGGAPTAAPVTAPVAPPAPPAIAPANAVPGQNYGAATAYTGGISPWNYTPGLYQPAF